MTLAARLRFQTQRLLWLFLLICPPCPLPKQAIPLDQPFALSELRAAVATVATVAKAKLPGLDGLSYELYETVFDSIGPDFLEALNCMLVASHLTSSLCQGGDKTPPQSGRGPHRRSALSYYPPVYSL
jgi:hypothetical protein